MPDPAQRGGRRSRPAAADHVEPAVERGQVHAGRGTGRRRRARRTPRPCRSPSATAAAGSRRRISPRVFEPFWQVDTTLTRTARRARARAGDRAVAGRGARRDRARRERWPWPRCPLHRRAAAVASPRCQRRVPEPAERQTPAAGFARSTPTCTSSAGEVEDAPLVGDEPVLEAVEEAARDVDAAAGSGHAEELAGVPAGHAAEQRPRGRPR